MFRHILRAFFRRASLGRAPRPRGVGRKAVRYRPELLDLESRTLLSTITWLQPTSGDFDDPAQWAGGRVPGPADDAVIPFAGITVSHVTGAADQVHSLRSQAALDLSAGSLTVGGSAASASEIDASLNVHARVVLTLNHVTLSGSGALTNAGTLSLSDATIDVAVQNNSGVLTATGAAAIDNTPDRPFVNGPAATLQVVTTTNRDPGILAFSNGFTNQGVLEIGTASGAGGGAEIDIQDGTLVNAPGATISFPDASGRFAGYKLLANLDNQGTLIDVAEFADLGSATSPVTVTNEGTIEAVQASKLEIFDLSFTNTGTIQLPTLHSVVAVIGGTFEQAGTAAGLGGFQLAVTHAIFPGDLSTDTVGLLLSDSTLDLSGGTLTNAADRNIDILDGTTINAPVVNLGSLNVSEGSSVINGQLTNAAGGTVGVAASDIFGDAQLAVTGGITNSGSITLLASVLAPPGQALAELDVTGGPLTNLPGGVVSASAGIGAAPGQVVLNAALDNQGTFTVDMVGLTLTGLPTNSGTLEVNSGVLTVSLPGPGAALGNSGSLSVAPAGQLILQGGDFVNTGSVAIDQGTLLVQDGDYVQADGMTQLADGGTLGTGSPTSAVRVEGGILAGSGTIASSLVNDAVVDATQLVVQGDYTQSAGADLVVEIAGVGLPDALTVAGQATLDGTLTVQLTGGFVPSSGDSIEALSGGSVVGTFANLDGDGGLFTPIFNPTNVTLVAN
jgi:hypothetical protein